MKRLFLLLLAALVMGIALTTFFPKPVSATSNQDSIRVLLKYKGGRKGVVQRALKSAGAKTHYTFDHLEAFVLTLPEAALDGISRNPNVLYVEPDPLRTMIANTLPATGIEAGIAAAADPYEEQVVPYGIDMVQARDVWDADRDGTVDTGAPTGAGKIICIIDSGIYAAHEDFSGLNLVGGDPAGWDTDWLSHGTHIAGTIGALNNSLGVVGVTPGTAELYIVKVFDDAGEWTYASTLIDAANQCASAGADIISMSLSGPEYSELERDAFAALFNSGIISVAAANNEGTSAYGYPASYDSVVSVAAINSSEQRASFSNHNDQVDLAAPGVSVLSTMSFAEINKVRVEGNTYNGLYLGNTARGTVTGELVNGGLCGSTDPVWSGKVVMCQRGTYTSYEKVLNIQNSGGTAALIYNTSSGLFPDSLGEGNTSTMVGITLSGTDGQTLLNNWLGSAVTVVSSSARPASGYSNWSGTSMAVPHVSAAAALVWSCSPESFNSEVRDALYATAKDLGTAGRDDYYGYGLVQAKDACENLNQTGIELISFTAVGTKKAVVLSWETATEFDNLGFNLYRAASVKGEKTKVNPELIPSLVYPGSITGAEYSYEDSGLKLRKPTYYWLEDLDIYGHTELHGPVRARTLNK